MHTDYLQTSIGTLIIQADEIGLTKVGLVEEASHPIDPSKITSTAKTQLEEYFTGRRKKFQLTYSLEHGPPFQQKVWNLLQDIPYGRTTSYLALAKKLGDPNSTRAVGMANGNNPIAIILPCHRVIGSDGSLTGYAYGTEIKRKLLALENPREYALNGKLF